MRAEDVRDLLRKRYPSQAWALLWEVGDATGSRHSRWADALAMGLWPSHGLNLHGFEIKVSRSDWLRELKDPSKSEAIAQYCDHWWLVTADDVMAKKDEIPPNWGWLAPKRGALRVMVPAKPLQPKPLGREFLAALLRSAVKPVLRAESAELAKAVQTAVQRDSETLQRINQTLTEKLATLTKQLIDFERFSGLTISEATFRWNQHEAKKLGQTVRDVLNGVYDRDRTAMEKIATTAEDVAQRVRQLLSEVSPNEYDGLRSDETESEAV